MLRHRQARRMAGLDQNDVTSVLAVLNPTRLLESLYGPLPRDGGQGRHSGGNLDFADLNGRRHSVGRASRQATSDCFADIVESFGLGPSLGDAAGNRRALGDEHAGFIGLQGHEQLHTWILSGLWPQGQHLAYAAGRTSGKWHSLGCRGRDGAKGQSRQAEAGPRVWGFTVPGF